MVNLFKAADLRADADKALEASKIALTTLGEEKVRELAHIHRRNSGLFTLIKTTYGLLFLHHDPW
jgi:hypothetical protein